MEVLMAILQSSLKYLLKLLLFYFCIGLMVTYYCKFGDLKACPCSNVRLTSAWYQYASARFVPAHFHIPVQFYYPRTLSMGRLDS